MMKLVQRCIYGMLVSTICGHLAVAGPPVDYSDWSETGGVIDSAVSCDTAGIDCTTSVEDSGFLVESVFGYERIVLVPLTCPAEHVCGDVVTGPTFFQQEFTDGANLWFQTAATNEIESSTVTTSSTWDATPFHLFDKEDGIVLKPGKHFVTAIGDTLITQPANLHLERDSLVADPDYIEINEQSAAEQEVYRKIIDAELVGMASSADAMLSAQLNVSLNIPDSYELQMRMLTENGWSDFVSDDHNYIAAASKLDAGYCPEVNSDLYQNLFGEGSECLRITLQDGGPNDGDGEVNGGVIITAGVILKYSQGLQVVEQASKTSVVAAQSNGGGAIWSLWLLGVLFFRIKRIRKMLR